MEQFVIHKGETFSRVLINQPSIDWHIIQEEGSRVCVHIINMYMLPSYDNTPKQHRIVVEQQGKGCTTEVYGAAFLHNTDKVEIETHVNHAVGGGQSNQLIKFVLEDYAKGRFVGDLKIAPDAQQTIAHQTNRNLLLSDDAEMRTLPQLEIYADDVKCAHGSTVGVLDTNALFYMQQRGIPLEEARMLLMFAFVGQVIDQVTLEPLRDRLHYLVEKRFRGELNKCTGCALCK